MSIKLLMAYNFSIFETHIEAPNFYKTCVERVFPQYNIETSFLPDFRDHFLYKLMTLQMIRKTFILNILVTIWIFKHGNKFDKIIGWATNGIIAAVIKCIRKWPQTNVYLILYKLPEVGKYGIRAWIKKNIIQKASQGAELILTLDKSQAKIIGEKLGRKPGYTIPFRYGVDSRWYEKRVKNLLINSYTKTIFVPGSAYRDDLTLQKAVSELNVHIKRFQFDRSKIISMCLTNIGNSFIEQNYNAPIDKYISECCASNLVVISVFNSDRPAGLTALLECMALGCPVIIPKGASSNDYVQDGITGLLYEEGNWKELKEKINYLIENPFTAKKLGEAAKEKVQKDFDIIKCGTLFTQMLINAEIISE